MSNSLKNLSELLLALMKMREDLHLQEVTDAELAILAAMSDLSDGGRINIHIQELRAHNLVKKLPKPSVYNAIGRLTKKKYCSHLGTVRSGLYRLERSPF